MAKHDKSKLQRLTDIDFSKQACHVALVPKGANGEDFLIVKSFNPEKDVKELDQHLSGASDTQVVKATDKSTNDGDPLMDDIKDKAPEQSADVLALLKSQDEMKEQLLAVTKANEAQAEELAVMKAAKDLEETEKFTELAKSLEPLGVSEDSVEVLKAVSALDAGDVILSALNKALDVLNDASDTSLVEVGSADKGVSDLDNFAQIEAIAKALQATNPELTKQAAIVKAAEQNPQLVG